MTKVTVLFMEGIEIADDVDGIMKMSRFSGRRDTLLYNVGVERSTTHRRLRQNSATLGLSLIHI